MAGKVISDFTIKKINDVVIDLTEENEKVKIEEKKVKEEQKQASRIKKEVKKEKEKQLAADKRKQVSELKSSCSNLTKNMKRLERRLANAEAKVKNVTQTLALVLDSVDVNEQSADDIIDKMNDQGLPISTVGKRKEFRKAIAAKRRKTKKPP